MSVLHSEARGDYAQTYSKSVISTEAFHNDFYTYSTKVNDMFQTIGTFTLVTTDPTKCPINRVLHLTGRKLYPGTNPMDVFVGNLTVPKFLVSVYDPVTFLTGYIDISLSLFAKYDQNLPNFFNQFPGSSIAPLGGQAGKLTVQDDGDQTIAASITGSSPTYTIPNPVATRQAGNATCGNLTITGLVAYNNFTNVFTTNIKVFTTSCNTNSKVILTMYGPPVTQTIYINPSVIFNTIPTTANAGVNIANVSTMNYNSTLLVATYKPEADGWSGTNKGSITGQQDAVVYARVPTIADVQFSNANINSFPNLGITSEGNGQVTGTTPYYFNVPLGYSVSTVANGYFIMTLTGYNLSSNPIFNWLVVN